MAAFLFPTLGFAGGSSSTCATRHPVILAHGMGASAMNLGIIDYWWGIDEALEDEGATVYVTSVNGMDATEAKARDFANQVFQLVDQIQYNTGAARSSIKFNIIAHSHGTLYSRYAIKHLGLAPHIVSHTSLCGPHRGSPLADFIMNNTQGGVLDILGGALDFFYSLLGDDDPNSIENGWALTADHMAAFNNNTPNVSGVYYQSWAAKAKTSCPNFVLEPSWLYILFADNGGANDGLVPVTSAKWGNFRGIEDAAWYSVGVDHFNMVDHLFGITPGFDAPEFFVDVVSELKSNGY